MAEFVGGATAPGSAVARTQIQRPWASLFVDGTQVLLSSRMSGPRGTWTARSSEYARQRILGSDYVGFREFGESDWTWFWSSCQTVNALEHLVVEAGFHQVPSAGRGFQDVFPVKVGGGILMMAIGMLVLAFIVADIAATGSLSTHHRVGAGVFAFSGLGAASFLMGTAITTVQLVWRRQRHG